MPLFRPLYVSHFNCKLINLFSDGTLDETHHKNYVVISDGKHWTHTVLIKFGCRFNLYQGRFYFSWISFNDLKIKFLEHFKTRQKKTKHSTDNVHNFRQFKNCSSDLTFPNVLLLVNYRILNFTSNIIHTFKSKLTMYTFNWYGN